MATIGIFSSDVPSPLQALLDTDIQPGADTIDYQVCKNIYLWHPLGQKIAEAPVRKAQSQARKITIPNSPEEIVVARFLEQWKSDRVDEHICNVATMARVYGISSLGLDTRGSSPSSALTEADYARDINIKTFDPLNTAGSLVLNQDPNDFDFMRPGDINVNGTAWHPSRTVVMINEQPVYLSYTNSAFGFVGRSVYQRAFYPLKSFLQTMIADDMVAQKLGLLIVKRKSPGAIVDNLMKGLDAIKRQMLKGAATGNVMSIEREDAIETLNMMNVDGAGKYARTNIITNIATATPMPARWLLEESLAEGFGEGSEDAKHEAAYVDGLRQWMQPLYHFCDRMTMRRAITPEFYKTVQDAFPNEYGSKDYEVAFREWSNSFTAEWPSLLTEPESERVKTDEIKFKAGLQAYSDMKADLDPENKAILIEWVCDMLNENKLLFGNPLVLDPTLLREHLEKQEERAEEAHEASTAPDEGGFRLAAE